jgi:hypothetical protein
VLEAQDIPSDLSAEIPVALNISLTFVRCLAPSPLPNPSTIRINFG